jgi:hypothetical protein
MFLERKSLVAGVDTYLYIVLRKAPDLVYYICIMSRRLFYSSCYLITALVIYSFYICLAQLSITFVF